MMEQRDAVLAIDSAAQSCTAAVWRRGRVFEVAAPEGEKGGERVFDLLRAALEAAGCGKEALAAVAFGSGPGAFSGLRVACGVAQGIAWGLGIPAVPVCNLRAAAVAAGLPAGTRALSVIDARMGEVYCAVYEISGDALEPGELLAPALRKPADAAALVAEYACGAVVGNAVARCPEIAALPGARALDVTAGPIARIGAWDLDKGRGVPAQRAYPLYVRNHIALTIEERRQGLRL